MFCFPFLASFFFASELKTKAKLLEGAGKTYNGQMEESRKLLEEEHLLVKALGSQLEGRELEVVTLQMELHHCSQVNESD